MEIKQEGLKTNVPQFRAGDTVRVHTKVVEGEAERIQLFDGVVIARKGSGIAQTFTVRKSSFGIGVERIFPIHSPRVEKIEVLKHGKVRRSKLFYLRELSGKAARIDEMTAAVAAGAAVAAPRAESAGAPAAVAPTPAAETPAAETKTPTEKPAEGGSAA